MSIWINGAEQGGGGGGGAQGSQGYQGQQGGPGPAGGGISIPYTFSSNTTIADPGNGTLRLNLPTQVSATTGAMDLLSASSTDVTTILDSLDDSTSPNLGQLRLVDASNNAKYLLFNLTAVTAQTGYRQLTIANGTGSANSPFSNGDSLLMLFSRTGDKGSQGSQGATGTGSQGSQGFQGAAGTGSQGSQGFQGAAGTGSQGSQGFQGAAGTGSQGAQGFQGAAGTGSQGSQGFQGAAGTGSQGAQGFQGAAGTGSQGAQGAAGTGSQGAQGAQGASVARTINAQTGTSYTLVLGDAGKFISLSNASPVSVTIPSNANVAFSTETELDFFNRGAGTVTLHADAGVTVESKNSAMNLTQYSGASIKKVATNTWSLVGDLS